MRVDVHTHFLPATFREHLKAADGPICIDTGSPHRLMHLHGSFPLSPGFRDMEARFEWMDRWDIDHTIASVSTPNPNEGPQSVETTISWTTAINEGFATLQDEHGDSFSALGSLPLRDPAKAVNSVDRVLELDLKGFALPTAVRGQSLADPSLTPVFEAIDETGLPVFFHPQPNTISHTFRGDEQFLNPVIVFPIETTVQLTRLIFAGFFDRHDFPVLIAHLGGALPYLVGRLDRGHRLFRTEASDPPQNRIADYLRSFYYDTIGFHPPAIELVGKTIGFDRMLFGSDYPFGMEDIQSSLTDLERVSISTDEASQIMGDGAADLFGV